ncbi:MAG TPA: endonuclease MutS2 [Nitrospirae bacterium]|nr:endonuclease MutS2 [Nitrospirota bacterium]
MKKQLYHKLDFQKVLQTISQWVHSAVSVDKLFSLAPLDSIDEIRLRSDQIDEIRKIRQVGKSVQFESFEDLMPLIKKVTPQGSMLDALELYNFIPFLYNIEEILSIAESSNKLKVISQSITSHQDLLIRLKRSVNSEGEVLDTASPALKEIRRAIKNLEGRIRKKLEDIIQSEEVSIFLQDTFITQRSGRWVIPVRMDSKGMISGVVHDVSKSGETAFIEPLSIINLTNELENLKADEKLEEVKVLKELSQLIRINSQSLGNNFQNLVYFDVLNAISLYADEFSMERPIVHDELEINLFDARHPLLYSQFKNKGIENQLVPLNIRLHHSNPIMVITGPNAGGKTVVIKTVGLLTIMALTGMHIPSASMSRIPFLKKILADIGDEQSIEDSISTFAGHISNLSDFIDKADKSSLVLIDELGTGTDPIEGSALSSAILLELRNRCSLVIANTHLSEIKGFVYRTEGMINAAMEFDPKTFRPMYKLSIGMPGQSYAFETANRYGLPERVIESARELLGSQKIELDNLIKELQDKRVYYENQSMELQKRLAELEELKEGIKLQLKEAENKRQDILEEAYKEAQSIIEKTREELFTLFDEAKKQDKQTIKASIKKAEKLNDQIKQSIQAIKPDKSLSLNIADIKVGDKVYSQIADDYVNVVSVNKRQNRLKINLRGIEFDVPVEDIRELNNKKGEIKEGAINITKQEDIPLSKINLIGKRVDEALSEIEPFINHCFLSGIKETQIIHGIGTGALKRAIRDFLKGHSLIKAYRDSNPSEGGPGVTIVSFY